MGKGADAAALTALTRYTLRAAAVIAWLEDSVIVGGHVPSTENWPTLLTGGVSGSAVLTLPKVPNADWSIGTFCCASPCESD